MNLDANILEAKKALTEKPLNAASAERFLILDEIKDKYTGLPQPLQFSHILGELLSRVSVPVEAYDLIAGRIVDRKLTEEEEAEVLAACEAQANGGKILTAAEIKKAFDERLGEDTAVNYVYRVMKRHGWCVVMPRQKHPKAASQEEQDSSKKLRP